MASQTTVVVVNWNGAAFLDLLLQSLQMCSAAKVIVVDNHSGDRSLEILARYVFVQPILNSENLGFATAANQGIAAAQTPFCLVMNADLRVQPDSIDILEQFLIGHPEVAIAAPQLLFPNGGLQPSLRLFPTPLRLFLYLSYLDRIVPSSYRLKADQHLESTEVEQPMGAALLLRIEALAATGWFDPQFYMYMEEVDLCDRIIRSGRKIAYVPAARMVHYAGGSSNQDWERTQRNYFESVIRYFRKRSGPAGLVFLRLGLAAALVLRSLVFALRGKPRKSWFYLRCAATTSL